MVQPNALETQPKQQKSDEITVKAGWVSWLMGWVIVPASVIGAIFAAGVMFGAHQPDSWFTRAVLWCADLF
jgi:hypothetical protein